MLLNIKTTWLIAGTLFASSCFAQEALANKRNSKPLPALTSGQKSSTINQIKERSMHEPVAVFFFASWCAACTPELRQLMVKNKAKDRLIGISIDDDRPTALSYFEGKKDFKDFKKRSYLDPEGLMAGRLGVKGLPAVITFSKGRIQSIHNEKIPHKKIKRILNKGKRI